MLHHNITAFLYSNNNFELVDKAKTFCEGKDITIFCVSDLKEFIIKKKEIPFCVLFIDTQTQTINEDLLKLLISGNSRQDITLVVYLCNSQNFDKYKTNNCIYSINCDNCPDGTDEIINNIKLVNMEYFKDNTPKNIQQVTYTYLTNCGFSPKHIGFTYLKDAICHCMGDNCIVGNLQSDVYKFLAAKYSTTVYGVERSIRLAIQAAFKNCHNNLDGLSSKPSNKEFIAISVNKLTFGGRADDK